MRFQDLTGKKFGQLIVIEKQVPQIGRTAKWKCKCDCGAISYVQRSNLCSGSTQSCGQHNYHNLESKRFGRLICLKRGKDNITHYGNFVTWDCICDCGKQINILAKQLTSGMTRSCGCLRKQIVKERMFKGYKDISGKYWSSVKRAALNRGLKFEISMEMVWTLYEKQQHKCALSGIDILFDFDFNKRTASIDRINNDLGYTLDNIQLVHKEINIMKNKFEQKKFINYCKRIANKN